MSTRQSYGMLTVLQMRNIENWIIDIRGYQNLKLVEMWSCNGHIYIHVHKIDLMCLTELML